MSQLTTRKHTLILLVGFFLALMPLFVSGYITYIATFASIYLIAAASFSIFSGYVGEFNLGYAFFIGIGGYTSAFLDRYVGLNPFFSIPIGGAFAMLSSLPIGLLSFRLRGSYFAIALLAWGEFAKLVVLKSYQLTGGDDGMYTSYLTGSITSDYYVTLLLAISTVFILYSLGNSDLGLKFKTIREDIVASENIGVNVLKYKIIAFMISSFFGGVAGSIFSRIQNLAEPRLFSVALSVQVFFMAYVGGYGTILGSIFGAYVLYTFFEGLRFIFPGFYRNVVYLIILVLIIFLLPKGTYGLVEEAITRRRKVEATRA